MKDLISRLLNKFYFSHRHNSICGGCMFRNAKQCPVATLYNKLNDLD